MGIVHPYFFVLVSPIILQLVINRFFGKGGSPIRVFRGFCAGMIFLMSAIEGSLLWEVLSLLALVAAFFEALFAEAKEHRAKP